MQRQMPFLNLTDSTEKEIDWDMVARCDTEQAAFRLCIHNDPQKRMDHQIADAMGMRKGTLSRILSSDSPHCENPRHMSRTQQIQLEQVCRNTAVSQWDTLYRTGGLYCQRSKADREAELVRELEQLRASK